MTVDIPYETSNVSNNTSYSKKKPIIDFEKHYKKFVSKHDHLRTLFPFWEQQNIPSNLIFKNDMISFSSGTPNECLFPIEKVEISLKKNPKNSLNNYLQTTIQTDDLDALDNNVASAAAAAANAISKSGESCSNDALYSDDDDEDETHLNQNPRKLSIRESLQYGDTCFGNYKALDMVKSLLIKFKNIPPYANWDYLITSGTSASCFKICQLLVDEDSTVLVEEFTYSVILSNIKFAHGKWIPVKLQFDTENIDNQGLDINYFAHLLDNWSTINPNKKKPTLFYTIPTGQNPTGMTVSMEKRQKIYDICCKHDIIIIEDDPYGYLKFPKYNHENPMENPYTDTGKNKLSMETYINDVLIPSYITIDTEGRVLRCETFSKICAPGLRLGFVVGNQYLIKKLMNIIDVSTREPSGLSQGALLNAMIALGKSHSASVSSNADKRSLLKTTPVDGWVQWCMNIAGEYLHRRNTVLYELYSSKAYKENQLSVLEPSAGMFASVVINLKDEWRKGFESKRAMDYLNYCLLEEGCDCILGYKMTVDENLSLERSNFLRITFAQASSHEILKIGSQRLAKAVSRLFDEYQTSKQKYEVPAIESYKSFIN